jgi:hypothetical protein
MSGRPRAHVRLTITQVTTRYRSLMAVTQNESALILILRGWPQRYTRLLRDLHRSLDRPGADPPEMPARA